MDPTRLKDATKHWLTGVGVVTTAYGDEKHGALVNNVACVSMDPPLYLACLGNSSRTLAAVLASRRFNIHFLASDQQAVAMAFAARDGDKFAVVAHEAGVLGAPVLSGALACIECELQSTTEAGSGTIVIGRVVEVRERAGEPLGMLGRDFVSVGGV
ncbi:flavin reductase family protein [Ramlibacter sp.]|uniref:flavin reductase family protein n=1 Tax=Ramlibacter sp. TaxID=1917967 RepID=UPI003D0CA2BF